MAVSAWGRICRDVIDRVVAVTPTVRPRQRWSHVPDSRSGEDTGDLGGVRPRQFSTREVQATDHVGVAGACEREEDWTLTIRASYLSCEDMHDQIAADYDDLIEALVPSSTYPGGTWGSLKVRQVLPLEGPDDGDDGEVVVRFPVRCIFRRPLTMV